jgi:hypothetical protein
MNLSRRALFELSATLAGATMLCGQTRAAVIPEAVISTSPANAAAPYALQWASLSAGRHIERVDAALADER